MIKASIIVTCYNKERFIARAINSCISQDFPVDQFEVIVVDDASTDNSRDVINTYRGFGGYHFVRTKFLKKNVGGAEATNIAINMARGKYILFVDGDDYIHKDYVKVMTEVLEWNPSIGFVYCDLIVVTKDSKHHHFELNTLHRLLTHGAAVALRKEYIVAIGGYDKTLRNSYDYDMLTRYRKKFSGYHLQLPYYRYFKEGSALSTQKTERKKLQKIIKAKHS